MIPPEYQLTPTAECGFCLEEFDCDYELVAVISGLMEPMKKYPTHRFFLPDWRNPSSRIKQRAVVEFFHLHCFLTRVADEKDVWKRVEGRWECGLCPEQFQKNRYAFQLQIGRIDFETGIFDPFRNKNNLGLLCSDCVTYYFGEGDHAEGKKVLGIE